jgi:starch-binding outer membrane protein, SusD/RagB family
MQYLILMELYYLSIITIMKKATYNLKYIILVFVIIFSNACSKSYLEVAPPGTLNEDILATESGVEGLLIGTYALLDNGRTTGAGWASSTMMFSGIASDDAHFGTDVSGGAVYTAFESYSYDATNFPLNTRWVSLYASVQRANDVLRVLAKTPASALPHDKAVQIKAEAIFLRTLFHFQLAMMWKNVPYIDETISYANGNYNVSNQPSIWPKLEEGFQYAADSLTDTKPDAGRVNSWAAKAFLADVYMFEHKYTEAKSILDDLIANGVTANGKKYALVDQYHDNFLPSKKNNSESVFACQMSVNDGATGLDGTLYWGTGIAGPFGGPFVTFGFYQPSFSLVNSFKTDPVTGLPLLYTWNDSDVTNDQGLTSTDPFTPYSGTLDPRLDWTVGRRGIPYLDWGINPGQSWVRKQSQAGPYLTLKTVAPQSEPQASEVLSTGVNYNFIRFADVLLWAAECEVEIGSLSKAEEYVNMIRARAANPAGFVKTYIDPNNPTGGFTNTPAANYFIGLYNGQFTANGQDYARDAVRFERKIETGMEEHRFFDLQRWDNGTGYMANTLNAYIQHETTIPGYNFDYMNGAHFTKGKNEIYAIPQTQIDLTTTANGPTLIQNPGY